MMLIFIGFFVVVMAVFPGGKFYNATLGGRITGGPIEPARIVRLVLFMIGPGILYEGIREIRH